MLQRVSVDFILCNGTFIFNLWNTIMGIYKYRNVEQNMWSINKCIVCIVRKAIYNAHTDPVCEYHGILKFDEIYQCCILFFSFCYATKQLLAWTHYINKLTQVPFSGDYSKYQNKKHLNINLKYLESQPFKGIVYTVMSACRVHVPFHRLFAICKTSFYFTRLIRKRDNPTAFSHYTQYVKLQIVV